MRTIKDVLRLTLDAAFTHGKIAVALRISRGAVAKYIGQAADARVNCFTVRALHFDQGVPVLFAPHNPKTVINYAGRYPGDDLPVNLRAWLD